MYSFDNWLENLYSFDDWLEKNNNLQLYIRTEVRLKEKNRVIARYGFADKCQCREIDVIFDILVPG